MFEQYKENRRQRKLAKKNNPKRKKVLKVLGGIALVLVAVTVAIILSYRDNKGQIDNITNSLNFYLNALKRPVDEQTLAPNKASEDDRLQFLDKCSAAGVVVEDDAINFFKSSLTSTLTFSANEFAAYINQTLASQVKILSSEMYVQDDIVYLKSVLKFDMTDVAQGTTFEDTGAAYLTSTSQFFYVGSKLAIKNSYILLNQLTTEENDKMIAFLEEMGVTLQQISPNDLFVEQLQDFVTKLGAKVSVDTQTKLICLN